jgi:hypothetical protein
MANSPFNIIKTHLWSEVKEYTWGNLTIGQNYKTVLGNVQSSQTTKKDNKKTFASTLLTGIGNVRKNLIRHYITGISVGSTAIRKTTRLLGSIVNVIVSTSKYIRSFISSLISSFTVLFYTVSKTVIAGINLNSNVIKKTTRLFDSIVNVMPSISKYIRSFISSLISSVSSLATKLIVQIRTIPKTVIAGINLNSNSIRKTTRLLGSIVNVMPSTSKYIRRFVSSLISSLTVLLYTITKTVIAGINLNSNSLRKTQSIVNGHVSAIGKTGINVVKIIKSITLGLSESVRLSLRTIMSNVSLNGAIVRRLIKSLISYSVLNVSTFRLTSKQIITSVLNSVFFIKLITKLINVQNYVIFTLKNNIYSTVNTLVNSYAVTVSKFAKQLKFNVVSSSMKLSTVAKQLSGNIQNISSKLVFITRTANTIVNGMASFLRGTLYRQLLVATVNIVYSVPLIKWADNKVRTWADLIAYRWHEFNVSTSATGVWKRVFRKISSSTNIVVNVKNNIKRLVTSYTNITSLIFRFVDRIIKNVTLLTVSTTNHIERLLKATSSGLASTSKYTRSFVSSLISSASSLATKLTAKKTVVANNNLVSNLLIKVQSVVNGYIGVIETSGRNISKFVSVYKTITSTLKNIIHSTVGTLVNSYAVKVSKSAKQLKTNIVSSSTKLSAVVKQLSGNIQNISSKLVFTARTVNTIVMGMVNFLHTTPYRKLLVATVNTVYNIPPIKWADNKVRTWADLTVYRWHEFDGTFATGVWKRVFRKISSSTNIVVNVKNNIKRLVTSYTNITSLIFGFVFRYVVSNVNSLSTSRRSVFKTTAVYILDLPVLVRNTWIKYQTNVLTAPQKINRTIKTFFIHLSANSKLLRSVLKNVVSSVLNINIRTTNIKRLVTSTVTGIADLVCNYVLKKIVSTTVKLIYVVPSEIWGNLSTKTWSALQSTYWWEWHRIGIAGMQRRIERISIGTVNTIASPVKRNIGKIITGIKNITSQTKKSINRTIQSFTDSLNNVTKTLHREAISSIKVDAISYKGFFQSMLTYIVIDASKHLTFFKIVSGLVSIANTFISRFGKAVVQEIEAIAVHATTIVLKAVRNGADLISVIHDLVYEIKAIRELSINMTAVHKIKQEVVWRMGANARGETLHMVLNETKVIELSVFDEDGTPSELDGATVKFAIGGAVEKDCGIVGNKITVMIEPDDIKNTGTYDYEFRLKDIFNRVDSLIMGKIIVEPKVVSAY